MRKFAVILVLASLGVGMVGAQSLEERLKTMASNNAKAYLDPFVTAFGTAMNSGWYFSAKPHKLLGFDLGIRAMAVQIPKGQDVFTWDVSALDITESITISGVGTYTVTLDPEQIYPEREVPTALGEKRAGNISPVGTDAIKTMFENQLRAQGVSDLILQQPQVQNQLTTVASSIPALETPPGVNLKLFPLAVPQAAIGLSLPVLPIKMEVAGRYLPEIELPEDLGKFKFYGIGGKLALDPFIPLPLLGIKIAAGAYMQKLEIGKIIESNHMMYSLQVSRDFNLLILGVGIYGGLGKESSDFKVKYTYYNDKNPNDPFNGVQMKFDLKGENDFRTTIGARIRLLMFNINADYSTGTDNVLTAGVGLTLR
jgi:hypothetical protein